VTRRFEDGTTYDVRVTNPDARAEVVTDGTLDGAPLAIVDGRARVPLAKDGRTHAVALTLGPRTAAGDRS